jgi:hypothetical protein
LPKNFVSDDLGLSNIRTHPSRSVLGMGQHKGENHRISAKLHHSPSRGRILNQLFFLSHGDKLQKLFKICKDFCKFS